MQRYNGADGLGVFFVCVPLVQPLVWRALYWKEFIKSHDFRAQVYEYKIAMHTPPPEPKTYRELPPDPTPVFLPRNDGYTQREMVDFPEFVRLARILKAGNYSIRARNKKLQGEYDSIRQMFGQLEGVTNMNNKEMDLTDYGRWLVDWLIALPPSEVLRPSYRVLRRLNIKNTHTTTQEERM